MTTLRHDDGLVHISETAEHRFQVTLEPFDQKLSVPRRRCETTLPVPVIAAFLTRSYAWLCESLARHEDPEYVAKTLRHQFSSYFGPEEFKGKRILDFGCGTGASTIFLAQTYPEAEIVGVELSPESVAIAREILAARQLDNVSFLLSPDPNHLPAGIGTFDFVVLSAVYEHLLPGERRELMPMLWSHMNFGGAILISQTPHRYFPYEHHTTGLWFINYCPDRMALWIANRFSRMEREAAKSKDWNSHLRRGIRGGTETEILRDLRRGGTGSPKILQPRPFDRAGYWLSCTSTDRMRVAKKALCSLFRLTDRLWGMVPSINIDVVIRKEISPMAQRFRSQTPAPIRAMPKDFASVTLSSKTNIASANAAMASNPSTSI